MRKYLFKNAVFLQSSLNDVPLFFNTHGAALPEIAFVGRSNVGKSSLINHLLKQKKLSKISSCPGKTETLNFFKIDDQLILVDLPGYGYACKSRQQQEAWNRAIDTYMTTRQELALIVLLIDIRRLPSQEDVLLMEWAQKKQKPLLLIFSKSDTINEHEKKGCIEEKLKILPTESYLTYSIKESSSRYLLISILNKLLNQLL